MRARAEPGSGRGLGPQTGAEIESQAEVGVAGRVYWDTAPVRRCLRSRDSRLLKAGIACLPATEIQPLFGSSTRPAMVSG